jgi:hypothetical protein
MDGAWLRNVADRDWRASLQVDYLIHRLDGVPQSQIDEWMAAGQN